MRKLIAVLLLLTSSALAAPNLGGREVLLVVSGERQDRDGEWLELAVLGLRHELGLTSQDLPVVRMGILDKDTDPAYFQRLGLKPGELPALGLVKWSQTEEEGPSKVVDNLLVVGAYRHKGLVGPRRLLISWLNRTARTELIPRMEAPSQAGPAGPVALALKEGRYEEAIRLARDEHNPELEAQARVALERQAGVAQAEGRIQLARSVYRTLAELYPDQEIYVEKIEKLDKR